MDSGSPTVELGHVVEVSVPLDPARFLEALDELVGNAVQHTPAGTPVKLSAQSRGGWLVVAVADAGPGIPRGEQARIFDRFARVGGGDRREGVGLRLAIVKTIAEAHGGSGTRVPQLVGT